MDRARGSIRCWAVAIVLVAATSACQAARVGGACRTAGFGTDRRSVLVCRSGHWRVLMSVAAYVRLLAARQPVTVVEPNGPVVESQIVVHNGARVLPTTVDSPPGPGPFPLVAFAHGFNSSPAVYARLLRGWAAAGFEVVAPATPGMAIGSGVLNRSARFNQPGDISAAITAMLSTGTVDPSRIAVVGHSDGGSTAAAMALTTRYRDPRVGTFVVLSGQVGSFPAAYGADNAGPLLAMVGDQDEFGNWPSSERVFFTANAPKALVVIHGGRHIDPFIDATNQAAEVRVSIIDFLRASFDHTDWTSLDADASRYGLLLSTAGAPPPTPTTTVPEPTTTTTIPEPTTTVGP